MTGISYNPLAYPAGWRTPGIDPTHPASRDLCFSGLVSGNQYYDLRTGLVGARSGAATVARIIHPIGPVCESTGFFGDMRSVFPAARPIALGDPFTFAGFVMTTNTPGYGASLFSNAANTSTYGAVFSINGGSWAVALNGSVSLSGSNQIFVQDRPFFWACSFFNGSGRIVSRDLLSGQLRNEYFGWDPGFKHQPGTGGASCMTQGGVSIQGYYGPEMWSATYLEMNELIKWSTDPWAFWFPPKKTRKPSGLSGVTIAVLRPDADSSISDWTDEAGGTTNIFNSIDETTFSDADYIKSPVPSGTTARFSLSNPATGKELGDPVNISYRFKKNAPADQKLTVSLKEGTTTIASWVHTGAGLTESFQTATQTLSTGQLATIIDFNNLFIEFQASPP
jgi:hypothetical protein